MSQQEFERRNRRYLYFFSVAAFVTLALAVSLGFVRVWSVWLLLAFFGLIGAGMYIDNRIVTQLGLRCPSCKRHLNSCSRFVLATGKCRCGAQVLDGIGVRP
jgi:hypothetical protein